MLKHDAKINDGYKILDNFREDRNLSLCSKRNPHHKTHVLIYNPLMEMFAAPQAQDTAPLEG